MNPQQKAIDHGLDLFLTLVRADADLAREFEASLPEFFRTTLPRGDTQTTLVAARRHVEWFVLERHSPTLRTRPAEGLLDAWRARAGEESGDLSDALLDSFTGVFQVTEVDPASGIWMRDMAGFGEYPVADSRIARDIQPRDLLVGRIFPERGAPWHLSKATALFRNSALVDALEIDLTRLRDGGRGNVLRLSQLELESMFFGQEMTAANVAPDALGAQVHGNGHSAEPQTDPVGDARRWLSEADIEREQIEAIFAHLRQHPFDDKRVLFGARDALADVLEELAFDTEADLSEASRILTLAWHAMSAPEPGTRTSSDASKGKRDRRQAVEAFGRALAQNADKEAAFRELERDLALDSTGTGDDGDDSPAPDFPGVVGAMIEEFRWERSRDGADKDSEEFEVLSKLSSFSERIGVFEELTAQQLLRFTTFWLPERGELASGDEATLLIDALDAFCAWAEEAHEHPLHSSFHSTLEGLRRSLPRIVEANKLRAKTDPDAPGTLYEYLGEEGLRDAAGEVHGAHIEEDLLNRLEPGDRLRGRIAPDCQAVVFCCYPPEVTQLSEASTR